LRETDLALRRKRDLVKIALARRLRKGTRMPPKWFLRAAGDGILESSEAATL
jgi:hypothetical protein